MSRIVSRDRDNPTDYRGPHNGNSVQRLELTEENISSTLTSVFKDNMVYIEYE